ncbi:hypothetical protein SLS60_005461 [Paraconiothyrium brasiliense]|uniref:Uncharacterized protein n=1 Tax=Paraconiothyrium brasiliense TaxID=300254 RepID=A0ABR3RI97_9PLEO
MGGSYATNSLRRENFSCKDIEEEFQDNDELVVEEGDVEEIEAPASGSRPKKNPLPERRRRHTEGELQDKDELVIAENDAEEIEVPPSGSRPKKNPPKGRRRHVAKKLQDKDELFIDKNDAEEIEVPPAASRPQKKPFLKRHRHHIEGELQDKGEVVVDKDNAEEIEDKGELIVDEDDAEEMEVPASSSRPKKNRLPVELRRRVKRKAVTAERPEFMYYIYTPCALIWATREDREKHINSTH